MESNYEFDAPQWVNFDNLRDEDDSATSQWFSTIHPLHEKLHSPEGKNNQLRKAKRRSVYCHSPVSRLVLKQRQKMDKFPITNRTKTKQELSNEIASASICKRTIFDNDTVLSDKLSPNQDYSLTVNRQNLQKPAPTVQSNCDTLHRSPLLDKKLKSMEFDVSVASSPTAHNSTCKEIINCDSQSQDCDSNDHNIGKPVPTVQSSCDTLRGSPFLAKKLRSMEVDTSLANSPPVRVIRASAIRRYSEKNSNSPVTTKRRSIYKKDSRRSALFNVFTGNKSPRQTSDCDIKDDNKMTLRSRFALDVGNSEAAKVKPSIKTAPISKVNTDASKRMPTKPRRSINVENDPELIKLIRKHNEKIAANKHKYDLNGRRLQAWKR